MDGILLILNGIISLILIIIGLVILKKKRDMGLGLIAIAIVSFLTNFTINFF